MSSQPSSRSELADLPARLLVVAGDEHRRVAVAHRRGVDHHRGRDRVEALHHPRLGERALDLLRQRVGVLHAQGRREALGEVQRVGDVEDHLAGEVVRAHLTECGQAGLAVGHVHHEVRIGGHHPERREGYVEAEPLLPRARRVGVAGADDHVVSGSLEALRQGPSGVAGADHCDSHSSSLGRSATAGEGAGPPVRGTPLGRLLGLGHDPHPRHRRHRLHRSPPGPRPGRRGARRTRDDAPPREVRRPG